MPDMTLIKIVRLVFRFTYVMVLLRVVLSWVMMDPRNEFYQFVNSYTEPLLKPFRSALNIGSVGIDFSPILFLMVLSMAEKLVISILVI